MVYGKLVTGRNLPSRQTTTIYHALLPTCQLQGLLTIRPAQCGGNVSAALTRLWVHEVQRVFGDRLVCQEDREWLEDLQQHLLVSKFGWRAAPADHAAGSVHPMGPARFTNALQALQLGDGEVSKSLFEGEDQVLFGDFMKMGIARQERAYEQLPSISKLSLLMERYLEEYNSARGKSASAAIAAASAAAAGGRGAGQSGGSSTAAAAAAAGSGSGSQMQLVFFQDAVLHVIRLARILRQPRWVHQLPCCCAVHDRAAECVNVRAQCCNLPCVLNAL